MADTISFPGTGTALNWYSGSIDPNTDSSLSGTATTDMFYVRHSNASETWRKKNGESAWTRTDEVAVFNVCAFGAVGDGTTDDHNAFADAIADVVPESWAS